MSTTLHFADALLADGWARDVRLTVSDGLIAAIDPATAPANHERHAVALPGLPNLHSHAFQRGMAGLAERRGPGDDSFWSWRETMYRFADAITPDDLSAIAALAYVEMLEAGFTRVGEFHYLHGIGDAGAPAMTQAIVAAAAESGIALSHLPVFYAHGGFGGTPPGERQRRFVHSLDSFARLIDAARDAAKALPDAIVGIAPHSLRAVTPGELVALEAMAPGTPLHLHIAEQAKEVDDCIAWSGARPIEWLLDHVDVDARWCLVHATHMTAAEIVAIARSRAVAGLCPITEANLGDGLFPAEPYLAAGGRWGIGSDSNVMIDATEELRLLEYGQRLASRGRNIFARAPGASSGNALWHGAVAGGAQALGAAAGIAIGAPADFVSIDASHPSLAGRHGAALLDAFVFAAGRGAIDRVWRRGAAVVSGGRHHARDAIVARYVRTLDRLLA